MEGSIATVRTGVSTEPDHAGPPQLLQHTFQHGMHLGKSAQVDAATPFLVTLQGGRINHAIQLAQPDDVAKQVLQDGHGDGVFTEA